MSEPAFTRSIQAVVIGASAGAVEALLHILPALPKDYPLAVLVVVHLPPDSESSLATLLASRAQIAVKEAEDKELIEAGRVYVAPPNYHLQVEPDYTMSLSSDDPVLFSRPSIDVLFESAADAYGDSVAGVVLTGGNSDGAHGLQMVAAGGGVALVQTPESAAYAEMPQAARKACPTARLLGLSQIAEVLVSELPRIRR